MTIDYKKEHNRYRYYFLKTKEAYQKPTVKASVNLVLTFLVVCFFAIFAIKPTLVTVVGLNKEMKEKKEVNKVLAEKINALEQAQINYGEIIEEIDLVDYALPEETEFDALAARINFLSYSHNLVLISASFGEFELVGLGSKELNVLDFKITVAGSFKDIKAFIKELEEIDRIIRVDSVSFSTRVGAVKTELQVDLNGRAFWLTRPEE